MRTLFQWIIGKSIRRQLIVGVAMVHLVLMSFFVYDLTQRQKQFLLDKAQSESLSEITILASSSKEYLRTHDLVGLQEVVETFLENNSNTIVMVIAPDGRVLSHSDKSKLGLFLQDSVSLAFLNGSQKITTLYSSDDKIEMVAPIVENKTLLGWARIASDFSKNQSHIQYVNRTGILYTILAILIGTLLAFILSWTVLRQLKLLLGGTDRLKKHQLNEPVPIISENEIGIVSKAFNTAMAEMQQQDISVFKSEARYRLLAETISDVIWILDLETKRFRYISPSITRLRGYTVDEALDQTIEESVTKSSLQQINDVTPGRIQQFMNGEVHSYTDIVEQFCKDGSTVWVEINSRYVKNEENGHLEVFGISRNIIERKRMEESLRESEAKFRSVFEHSIDAIGVSKEGTHVFVNRAYVTLFGYTNSDEIAGTPIIELIAPSERKKILDIIQKRANGETVATHYETLGFRKDHSEFVMDVNISLYEMKGEKYTLSIFRDITERKQTEKQLQLSEEKFRMAFVTNPDTVAFTRLEDGMFVLINNGFTSLLGYTAEEIIGKKSSEVRLWEIPEERSRLIKVLRTNGIVLNLETVFRAKNGELKNVLMSASIIVLEGVEHILSITRDITERKKGEEYLRLQSAALESAINGIVITNRDGTIEWVNNAYEKITGYSSDEAVGKNHRDLVKSGKMSDDFYKQLWDTIIIGKFWQGEIINRKKDGTLYTEEQTITPVVDGRGEIKHFIGIKQDITQRKTNEQIVQDVQRRESIGVLAGGIAHDFNNLLNAMMGNISLVQTRLAPDHPAKKNVDWALSAMERAALLTKQLLAYSGKGKFQIREIDLVALIKEHINLFEVSLHKNVTVAFSLPEVSVFVKGDPGQVEQVIMNLIINAGDAIGEKQGTVFIKVASQTMTRDTIKEFRNLTNTILKEGDYALIEVSDNGIGISSGVISKIFDPFFTTKTTGRGLGLSAVLGILHGHEGGVTIETVEGVGTTFRVLLPLVHASESTVTVSNADKKLAYDENVKILIIDDEQYILDVTNDILETKKYQLILVNDSVRGVSLYKDQWQTIDVVILDYAMPKMNGKEVFIELRKINPDVKVIISSGYTEEEIIDLMGDARPNLFLQKPHADSMLLSAVSTVLEMK